MEENKPPYTFSQLAARLIQLYGRQRCYARKPPWSLSGRNLKNIKIRRCRKPNANPRPRTVISIPGVNVVFNSNANFYRRLLWSITLAATAAVCVYQGVDRLSRYLSNPVEIKIKVSRNQTVKFPSFTLCPFDINGVNDIRKQQEKFAELSKGKTTESVWNLLDFANLTNYDLWQLNHISENNTKVEFMMKKALPLTKPFSNISISSAKAYLGTCMTISTDSDMDFMGSAFVLKIEQNDHLQRTDDAAFTIYPHADGVTPKHHAYFKGNIILRGQKTAIALSMTKFKYLNRSTFKCDGSIAVAACWTNCIEDLLVKKATCRLPYMRPSHLPSCNTTRDSNRTYTTTQKLYLTTPRHFCKCLESCEDDIFQMDVDVRGPAENKTILEIFFVYDTFEVIEEVYSYKIVDFVCDLGGNLGFYLGFCLLTVLEIVEVAWLRLTQKIVKVSTSNEPIKIVKY